MTKGFVDIPRVGIRASTVTKNWKFVRVCTICTSPYPYKNRPSYRKIVLNRTFVDALSVAIECLSLEKNPCLGKINGFSGK